MVRAKLIAGRRPQVTFAHAAAKTAGKPAAHALSDVVATERPRPSQSAPRQPFGRARGNPLDTRVTEHLSLGEALGDGNCFFDSLMQLAGAQLAAHLNVNEEDVEPSDLRFHGASTLLRHLEICATDPARGRALMTQYPHLEAISELSRTSDRGADDPASLRFSPARFRRLLRVDRARYDELSRRIPREQLRLVCNIADDGSYDNMANEFVAPITTAAFPGLRVAVVTSEMTMGRLLDSIHGIGRQEPHLLFLDQDAEHYVPAFQVPPIDWRQLQQERARRQLAAQPVPAPGPFPAPRAAAAPRLQGEDSLIEALKHGGGDRLARTLGLRSAAEVRTADVQRHVAGRLVDQLIDCSHGGPWAEALMNEYPHLQALQPHPGDEAGAPFPAPEDWQKFEQALGEETALSSLRLTPLQRRLVHGLATGESSDMLVRDLRPAVMAATLELPLTVAGLHDGVLGAGDAPPLQLSWANGRYEPRS